MLAVTAYMLLNNFLLDIHLTERKNVIETIVLNASKLPYISKDKRISLWMFSYVIAVFLTQFGAIFSLRVHFGILLQDIDIPAFWNIELL